MLLKMIYRIVACYLIITFVMIHSFTYSSLKGNPDGAGGAGGTPGAHNVITPAGDHAPVDNPTPAANELKQIANANANADAGTGNAGASADDADKNAGDATDVQKDGHTPRAKGSLTKNVSTTRVARAHVPNNHNQYNEDKDKDPKRRNPAGGQQPSTENPEDSDITISNISSGTETDINEPIPEALNPEPASSDEIEQMKNQAKTYWQSVGSHLKHTKQQNDPNHADLIKHINKLYDTSEQYHNHIAKYHKYYKQHHQKTNHSNSAPKGAAASCAGVEANKHPYCHVATTYADLAIHYKNTLPKDPYRKKAEKYSKLAKEYSDLVNSNGPTHSKVHAKYEELKIAHQKLVRHHNKLSRQPVPQNAQPANSSKPKPLNTKTKNKANGGSKTPSKTHGKFLTEIEKSDAEDSSDENNSINKPKGSSASDRDNNIKSKAGTAPENGHSDSQIQLHSDHHSNPDQLDPGNFSDSNSSLNKHKRLNQSEQKFKNPRAPFPEGKHESVLEKLKKLHSLLEKEKQNNTEAHNKNISEAYNKLKMEFNSELEAKLTQITNLISDLTSTNHTLSHGSSLKLSSLSDACKEIPFVSIPICEKLKGELPKNVTSKITQQIDQIKLEHDKTKTLVSKFHSMKESDSLDEHLNSLQNQYVNLYKTLDQQITDLSNLKTNITKSYHTMDNNIDVLRKHFVNKLKNKQEHDNKLKSNDLTLIQFVAKTNDLALNLATLNNKNNKNFEALNDQYLDLKKEIKKENKENLRNQINSTIKSLSNYAKKALTSDNYDKLYKDEKRPGSSYKDLSHNRDELIQSFDDILFHFLFNDDANTDDIAKLTPLINTAINNLLNGAFLTGHEIKNRLIPLSEQIKHEVIKAEFESKKSELNDLTRELQNIKHKEPLKQKLQTLNGERSKYQLDKNLLNQENILNDSHSKQNSNLNKIITSYNEQLSKEFETIIKNANEILDEKKKKQQKKSEEIQKIEAAIKTILDKFLPLKDELDKLIQQNDFNSDEEMDQRKSALSKLEAEMKQLHTDLSKISTDHIGTNSASPRAGHGIKKGDLDRLKDDVLKQIGTAIQSAEDKEKQLAQRQREAMTAMETLESQIDKDSADQHKYFYNLASKDLKNMKKLELENLLKELENFKPNFDKYHNDRHYQSLTPSSQRDIDAKIIKFNTDITSTITNNKKRIDEALKQKMAQKAEKAKLVSNTKNIIGEIKAKVNLIKTDLEKINLQPNTEKEIFKSKSRLDDHLTELDTLSRYLAKINPSLIGKKDNGKTRTQIISDLKSREQEILELTNQVRRHQTALSDHKARQEQAKEDKIRFLNELFKTKQEEMKNRTKEIFSSAKPKAQSTLADFTFDNFKISEDHLKYSASPVPQDVLTTLTNINESLFENFNTLKTQATTHLKERQSRKETKYQFLLEIENEIKTISDEVAKINIDQQKEGLTDDALQAADTKLNNYNSRLNYHKESLIELNTKTKQNKTIHLFKTNTFKPQRRPTDNEKGHSYQKLLNNIAPELQKVEDKLKQVETEKGKIDKIRKGRREYETNFNKSLTEARAEFYKKIKDQQDQLNAINEGIDSMTSSNHLKKLVTSFNNMDITTKIKTLREEINYLEPFEGENKNLDPNKTKSNGEKLEVLKKELLNQLETVNQDTSKTQELLSKKIDQLALEEKCKEVVEAIKNDIRSLLSLPDKDISNSEAWSSRKAALVSDIETIKLKIKNNSQQFHHLENLESSIKSVDQLHADITPIKVNLKELLKTLSADQFCKNPNHLYEIDRHKFELKPKSEKINNFRQECKKHNETIQTLVNNVQSACKEACGKLIQTNYNPATFENEKQHIYDDFLKNISENYHNAFQQEFGNNQFNFNIETLDVKDWCDFYGKLGNQENIRNLIVESIKKQTISLTNNFFIKTEIKNLKENFKKHHYRYLLSESCKNTPDGAQLLDELEKNDDFINKLVHQKETLKQNENSNFENFEVENGLKGYIYCPKQDKNKSCFFVLTHINNCHYYVGERGTFKDHYWAISLDSDYDTNKIFKGRNKLLKLTWDSGKMQDAEFSKNSTDIENENKIEQKAAEILGTNSSSGFVTKLQNVESQVIRRNDITIKNQERYTTLPSTPDPKLIEAKIVTYDGENLLYIDKLTAEQRRACSHQLADNVAYLHAHGFLHRDIKLENILYLVLDDGSVLCTLIDYGAAYYKDDYGYVIDPKFNYTPDNLPLKIEKNTDPEWTKTEALDTFAVGRVMAYLALIMGQTEENEYRNLFNPNQKVINENPIEILKDVLKKIKDGRSSNPANSKKTYESRQEFIRLDNLITSRIQALKNLDKPIETKNLVQKFNANSLLLEQAEALLNTAGNNINAYQDLMGKLCLNFHFCSLMFSDVRQPNKLNTAIGNNYKIKRSEFKTGIEQNIKKYGINYFNTINKCDSKINDSEYKSNNSEYIEYAKCLVEKHREFLKNNPRKNIQTNQHREIHPAQPNRGMRNLPPFSYR